MAEVFSFTYLSDGTQVFLGRPQADESKRDDSGYQFFDVFDDEYLENKIGMLGISVTDTVSAMWNFGEENNARDELKSIMKLALPLIDLPISPQQVAVQSGYFSVIQLFSEGDIFYDETNRIIHIPSGASPQEFFKSTLFGGKISDSDVKRVILTHAYVEGIKDTMGDFRFVTIEITKDIWPINPERVTKAYRGLVNDGLLLPTGGNTSSGFPSMTKLSPEAQRMIEETNKKTAPTPEAMYLPQTDAETTPTPLAYIAPQTMESIVKSASDKGLDTTKLEMIMDELNDAAERNKPQSAHALVRTLLNHIAPLFGYPTFAQVANNHKWTQTDKNRVRELETIFRFDADESLHSPISKRNTAVDMHSIGVIRRTVNVILQEAVEQP